MKFLEETLLQTLDDLKIPHQGYFVGSDVGQARLSHRVPFIEVMDQIRNNPKYGPKMSPHPWGAYIYFKNLNCPREKALVDVCLDLRASSGDLVGARCSLVFARVFRASGDPIHCLSLREMEAAVGTSRYEDREEAVVDAT